MLDLWYHGYLLYCYIFKLSLPFALLLFIEYCWVIRGTSAGVKSTPNPHYLLYHIISYIYIIAFRAQIRILCIDYLICIIFAEYINLIIIILLF